MTSQAELYQYVIAAGGSPEEARYLASFAMAESGGQSVKSSVDPNSWGPWQVNLDAWDYPVEYVMNPQTAASAALDILRTQGPRAWSVYQTGDYQKYLGGGENMPTGGTWANPGNIFGSGSSGSGGQDYVYDPRTGQPMGFYDEYGEFIRLPSLPGGSSSARWISIGGGFVMNSATGEVRQGYGSASPTPTRDVSVRPISGSNQLGYYDQNGNLIQMGQDPGYVNPIEQDQWAWQKQWGIEDRQRAGQQFDWNKQRDLADITGMYGGAPTERRYEFDTTNQRLLDQFDAQLGEDIAARQQRLIEQERELASLEKRADQQAAVQREQIQASIRNTQAEIAGRIQVAQMDNSTRLSIAKTEQETAYRGQDVQKLLGLRGQDVQYKLGQADLAQRGLESFAEMQGRDPFRASLMAYGDRGGQTPQEGLLSQMQGIQSSLQAPLSYDLAAYGGAQPTGTMQPVRQRAPQPRGFAHGGSVVESDQPVLAIVGERRPEAALLPPGSVVQPINAGRGDSMEEMRMAAMQAMPAMRQRAMRAGITPMAEGGAVSPQGGGGFNWNDWARRFHFNLGAWNPTPRQPAPVQPVSQPATYSNPYALSGQGEATMANALKRIFDAGANIRPGEAWGVQPEPLYGVDVPDPTQWAYSYTTRPLNEQKLMTSAAGVVGWGDAAAQAQRRAAVTPTAISPFNVAYGWDGLAVRPIAA